jgi:drug/metabolite transporter (DMT)-like permease
VNEDDRVDRLKGRAGVIAAYAAMCAIWGTTWLAIKVSLHFVPPLAGAGLRFVLAGAVLYAAAAVSGQRGRGEPTPWRVVAALAVLLFGLNYTLTYVAETRLDSGLVAVLFGTLPFFVFAFGHFVNDERTTIRIWLGALVALAGVAAISVSGQVRASPLFALAAVVAACVSALGNVYAKRHAQYAPLRTLAPAMLWAGVAVFLLGLATERVDWALALSAPSLGALAYLAILGSSIAFFLNLWLLQRIDTWIVGLSALIIPAIAVAVGILLGGEAFTWRELAGSALVIAGIWIALSRREAAAEFAVNEYER